jgi:DtxR family transcriptional regulator, Mn-dependent transcriptional regulator
MAEAAILLLSFLGLLTLLFLIFRSSKGWFWIFLRKLSLSDRVLREDALKYFSHCELENEDASLLGAAGSLGIRSGEASRIISQLVELKLLQIDRDGFRLSSEGRRYGLRMIRAHRLYETYMSEKSGYKNSEWHEMAERAEHALSEDDINALDRVLCYPVYDPHGDPIPTEEGHLNSQMAKVPLTRLAEGQSGVIVHLEDEPKVIYSQLCAEGLYPGLQVKVLESDSQRIRFWSEQDEHLLAPLLAASIHIVLKEDQTDGTAETSLPQGKLSDGRIGQSFRIKGLSPHIHGSERRRLMDLGFLPGTLVEKELVSAGGDTIGFRVRGTLIALRRSQADLILTELPEVVQEIGGKL